MAQKGFNNNYEKNVLRSDDGHRFFDGAYDTVCYNNGIFNRAYQMGSVGSGVVPGSDLGNHPL